MVQPHFNLRVLLEWTPTLVFLSAWENYQQGVTISIRWSGAIFNSGTHWVMLSVTLSWASTTPLGWPVVPLVYI